MRAAFLACGAADQGQGRPPGAGACSAIEPGSPGRLLPPRGGPEPRGWGRGREGAAGAPASEGTSHSCRLDTRCRRSRRARPVAPVRSVPASSACCPSPRPAGPRPLWAPRPAGRRGLDAALKGCAHLGAAPVAEWLFSEWGTGPGQRPGIPEPRLGSWSGSEHGPRLAEWPGTGPQGLGAAALRASGSDAYAASSLRPRGQSPAAGGAGRTPGDARTRGHGSRALCPARGRPAL